MVDCDEEIVEAEAAEVISSQDDIEITSVIMSSAKATD